MHHSQLEYLIAVQKLQGEEMGAQGNKLAEEMDVSTGYILKLTKAAEQKGYVRRGKAFGIYHRSGNSGNAGISACGTGDGTILFGKRFIRYGSQKRSTLQRMRNKKNNATSIDKCIQTIVYDKINFFAYEFAYENLHKGKGHALSRSPRATGIQTTLKEKKENARCC